MLSRAVVSSDIFSDFIEGTLFVVSIALTGCFLEPVSDTLQLVVTFISDIFELEGLLIDSRDKLKRIGHREFMLVAN